MDVYRVYAYVEESLGNYNDSITAYKEAAKIIPNLTFLYNSIAKTYRHLRQYEPALELLCEAVAINENLGVKDPNSRTWELERPIPRPVIFCGQFKCSQGAAV